MDGRSYISFASPTRISTSFDFNSRVIAGREIRDNDSSVKRATSCRVLSSVILTEQSSANGEGRSP
jgi:hypothetical protein